MCSLGNAGAGFNLLKEFNFHPITVVVAIARFRLLNKIIEGKFKTVIGSLFRGGSMGNWGKQSRDWLFKRNLIEMVDEKIELLRTVKYTILDEVWTSVNIKLSKGESLTHSGYVYSIFEFIASRDYIYQDKGIQWQKGLTLLSGLRTGSFWSCFRLSKIFRDKYEDWNYSCPFCDMDQAENIEHLLMTCLKWNKERTLLIKGITKDWEKINPSKLPTVDWITILGGVNERQESLMPWWLEGLNWKEDNPDANAIAPLYLHVVKFLDKIGDRRRMELLRIQKLKSRIELTNEAFPDQESISEGSEDNFDLQDIEDQLDQPDDE